MKSRVVKALALLSAGVMMTSLIGCGNTKNEGTNAESKVESSADNKGTDGDVIEVTIPSYKAGENAGAAFFLPQVDRFNEKYEGKYKLSIEEVPQASYGEKIKQLAQQNKLPAIIHGTGSGEVDVQWFNDVVIKNDMYYDLSTWMNDHPEIKELGIKESMDYNTTEDGKVVAMPLVVARPKSIFYNTTLYTPEKPIREMTMDEFIDSMGDNTIALQTADNGWVSGLFWTGLIANEPGGAEVLEDNVETMLYDFNAEPIVSATAKLQDLLMNHSASNTIGAAYADAANNFMSAQSAFIANGTWMSTDLEDDSDKWSNGFQGSDVKADLFPGNFGIVTAQIHDTWIANSASDDEKELALAYLEFVYSPEELEAYMLSDGGTAPNYTPSEEFIEMRKENSLLNDIAEASTGDSTFAPNILDIIPTSVAEAEFGKLLPKLADGSITPEDFCKTLTEKAEATK